MDQSLEDLFRAQVKRSHHKSDIEVTKASETRSVGTGAVPRDVFAKVLARVPNRLALTLAGSALIVGAMVTTLQIRQQRALDQWQDLPFTVQMVDEVLGHVDDLLNFLDD
ncbi:MAG: hypothetical protein JJU24_14090 [Natronohydrobacter sp.]|nr:hypothetical protein [Natronohydrobacter sp.]